MSHPTIGAAAPGTSRQPRRTRAGAQGRQQWTRAAGQRSHQETRPARLSVIVPVYNGTDRLPAALAVLADWLHDQPFVSELVIVDDCSDSETAGRLASFASKHSRVVLLKNERNLGKGASVARGMLAATGHYRVFTDADLAYPPSEIAKILNDLEAGADVAIACRVLPASRYDISPSYFHYLYTRHVMSRVFNLLVRTILLRDVLDTQAGLKGYTAQAASVVFSRLTIPRFGFDVETLFVAQMHGLSVRQTAVCFRYNDEPTTVRFIRSAVRMALDLAQIRLNHFRGRYA